MTKLRVFDIDLYYEIIGEGDPILFIHGLGSSTRDWEEQIEYFSKRYQVVVFDVRGHGKSDKPKTGYHMDDMANDVSAVMDKLGVEKAHFVGSSMGVEVGLSMAVNHSDKVLSLTCEGAMFSEFGPYGLFEGSESEFKEHVAQRLDSIKNSEEKFYPSIDAIVEDSRKSFEQYGWWSDIFEGVKRYDAVKVSEGEYLKGWRKFSNLEYTKHYMNARFEDYYAKVKCSVLMLPDEIPGMDEKEKAAMEGFFALAGKGKIVYVPGLVHPFGWMLTPDEISKAVLEFLAELIY
jgi:pimeloyl-ACP methyl ester carboxylesterase